MKHLLRLEKHKKNGLRDFKSNKSNPEFMGVHMNHS